MDDIHGVYIIVVIIELVVELSLNLGIGECVKCNTCRPLDF